MAASRPWHEGESTWEIFPRGWEEYLKAVPDNQIWKLNSDVYMAIYAIARLKRGTYPRQVFSESDVPAALAFYEKLKALSYKRLKELNYQESLPTLVG